MRSAITLFDLNTGAEYWTRLYLVNAVNQTARMYTMDIELENETIYVLVRGDDDGTSATDVENYLYKTDMSGNIQWARKYNLTGGNNEQAREMVSVSDGFIFTGYFNNNTSGSDDIYIIKTDKDGIIQWSKVYDSGGNDRVSNNCLIPDNDGVLLIGKSDEDILLMRVHADGSVDSDNCTFINDLMVAESTMLNPYDGQFNMTTDNHPLSVMSGNATPADVDLPANVLCATPCAEICDNGLDDDGDGLVDYFDPDCPCSDSLYCGVPFYNHCIPDCSIDAPADTFSMVAKWEQSGIWRIAIPVVGDIDGDCHADIAAFSSSQTQIYVVEGSTGQLKYSYPISNSSKYTNIAIADVDDDGMAEIFCVGNTYKLYRLDYNPLLNDLEETWESDKTIFSNSMTPERNFCPSLADFDQNGIPEVYAGNQIFHSATGIELTNGGSNNQGTYPLGTSNFMSSLSIAADVLTEGVCPNCQGLELVAGNQVYTVSINSYTNPTQNSMTVERELQGQQDGATRIVDFDLDGDLDAVVTSMNTITSGDHLYIWDMQTENLIGNDYTTLPNTGGTRIGAASISDVDGDKRPEIIICTRQNFSVVEDYLNGGGVNWGNSPTTLKSNMPTTDDSGATGMTVFDFNGDGKSEIVYRDENVLRVLDENLNVLSSFPCISGTAMEYPVIADIDNDGAAEILCGCQGSGLRAFESANTPWMNARKVWNQYSYFVVNVNDDGTIPAEQQMHHIVGDSSILNNFLEQQPILNNDGTLDFPVSDLALDIAIDTTCPRDTTPGIPATYFNITICNIGDAVAPADIPIQIYTGNPTTGSVANYFNATTTQIIPIDSCITETILVPIDIGNYYMVINDNASLLTPYDLENDFPVTPVAECNFLNNIDSFVVAGEEADLDLGPDTLMCDNGTVTFNAGSSFFYYNWQDGSSDSVFTAYGAGIYHVTVSNGCVTLTDTVIIEVDSTTVLDLGPDIGICGDDTSVMISLSGFTGYQWFPSDYLDCDTCATVTASPPDSQTYIVVANNESGCYSVDTITIIRGQEYNDTLQFVICPEDTLWVDTVPLVPGDMMQFNHLSKLDCDSVIIYQVSSLYDSVPQSTMDTSTCPGASVVIGGIAVAAGTTQTLVFTTSEGCDSLVTVTVAEEQEPLLDLGADTAICDNDSVALYAGSGFFTYQWQDGSTDSVFIATAPGVYAVTVSDACFVISDTVIVTLDSATILNLGADIVLCGTDTATTISLAGFDYYQWTPSDYLDCDTCATVIASPPNTQTYVVTASNEDGCYSVDTITIMRGQEYSDTLQFAICPEDTLWVDTVPLVAGDNMQIHHLSVLGCDSIVTYQVSGLHDSIPKSSIDTSACLGTSVNIGGFTIPAGLTQVLQFTSSEGCDSLVTVTVAALDTFDTKDTIEICPGDTATIFGQSQTQAGNYTITFATPEGCDSVHTTTLIVLPTPITNESITICDGDSVLIFGQYESQAGQYSAEYTAANGCDSTHIVTLNVIPPIQIGMNIEPSCPNDSTGSISLNISGGQAPYTYTWDHSGIDSNEVFDLPAGDYGVTITDAEGCSAEAIITVDAITPPLWTAGAQDANCAGVADGAIVISAITPGLTYSLDGITFQSDTIFSNLTAGEYDVFAEDAFGCVHMQTVIISEPFDWNVFLPEQYTIQWGESVQIEGQTNAPAGSVLQWIPADNLSCVDCINPHASPVTTTDYTLIITDPTGCIDSATVRVNVEIICDPDRLGIPNVFTPNLDGHNDYFGIAKENGPETITSFRIYDRWGELIFEGVGRDAKWDGRFKGKDMPAGVYVYIIEYVCADDSEGRAVGDVTLVR